MNTEILTPLSNEPYKLPLLRFKLGGLQISASNK